MAPATTPSKIPTRPDYILFARARGDSKWTMIRRHGLRNIILPAMTLQFASISEIFGGSVLVEQVFSYTGMGQAAVTAGLGGDIPVDGAGRRGEETDGKAG